MWSEDEQFARSTPDKWHSLFQSTSNCSFMSEEKKGMIQIEQIRPEYQDGSNLENAEKCQTVLKFVSGNSTGDLHSHTDRKNFYLRRSASNPAKCRDFEVA